MKQSTVSSWDKVWQQNEKIGSYGCSIRRYAATKFKIYLYQKWGVELNNKVKVLEAGCGEGSLIVELVKSFNVQGHALDFSPQAIKRTEELAIENSVNVRCEEANILATPYKDNTFDVIISNGVIEHFTNPKEPTQEMFRILKPGGKLLLMVPNTYSYGVIDRLWQTLKGEWPFGYQKEISPSGLKKIALSSGFAVERVESILRPNFPQDREQMTRIVKHDNFYRKLFPKWGFFSWIVAVK